MDAFAEGYSFFEKNSGSYTAAAMGDAYVGDVNNEIATLLKDMNGMERADFRLRSSLIPVDFFIKKCSLRTSFLQ